jgi:hypothetical protein
VGFVARSSSHDAFMCWKPTVKAKMIWEEPDLYLGALLIFNQYLLGYLCSWTKIRQSDKIFDWRCTLQYWCWDIWSSTFVWNVKVWVIEVLLYLFNFCMKFVPKFCSSWKPLFQVIVFWNTCKSLFQVLLYFNFGVKFVIKVLFKSSFSEMALVWWIKGKFFPLVEKNQKVL